MKRTLLSVLLFAGIAVNAQQTATQGTDDRDRGYVALSVGAAIPFGDFVSTSSGNDDASYALTGGSLQLNVAYRIGKNLGLAAMIGGGTNPVNTSAFESTLHERYPNANWSVKADPWRHGEIMIGGFATFPAGDRSSFDIRLLVGGLSSTSPAGSATGTSGVIGATWNRQEKTGSGGALDLGFIYRFRISNSLCFLASADFLSAKINFDNVHQTSSLGTDEQINYDENLRVLNLSLGIGLTLK